MTRSADSERVIDYATRVECKIVQRWEVWCDCGWTREFADSNDAYAERMRHIVGHQAASHLDTP